MAKTASQMAAYRAKQKTTAKTQQGHYDKHFKTIGKNATAFIADDLGIDNKEAKRLGKAVQGYTGSDYKKIRNYQKGKSGFDDYAEQAEALEEYISKAPKWAGSQTFRGVVVRDQNTLTEATTVGNIISMGGTSSWSTRLSTAEDFASGVIFVSKTQSKGTSIKHLSKQSGENEVVVSKDARFKIINTKHQSDYVLVEVEEM